MEDVLLDGKVLSVTKNVMTASMDMTVSTTVVATAGASLHVTNRLVTVTGDVNLDIPMFSVATYADRDTMVMSADTSAMGIV